MAKLLSYLLVVILVCGNAISESQPISPMDKNLVSPALWSDQVGSGCEHGLCNNWVSEARTCKTHLCLKRSSSDEMGPFWANRGKREPQYQHDQLYADEPHWILMRRDEDAAQTSEYDPFFITRGKKRDGGPTEFIKRLFGESRGRSFREYAPPGSDESPFFAARGKKNEEIAE